jgi:hypothetical protein
MMMLWKKEEEKVMKEANNKIIGTLTLLNKGMNKDIQNKLEYLSEKCTNGNDQTTLIQTICEPQKEILWKINEILNKIKGQDTKLPEGTVELFNLNIKSLETKYKNSERNLDVKTERWIELFEEWKSVCVEKITGVISRNLEVIQKEQQKTIHQGELMATIVSNLYASSQEGNNWINDWFRHFNDNLKVIKDDIGICQENCREINRAENKMLSEWSNMNTEMIREGNRKILEDLDAYKMITLDLIGKEIQKVMKIVRTEEEEPRVLIKDGLNELNDRWKNGWKRIRKMIE